MEEEAKKIGWRVSKWEKWDATVLDIVFGGLGHPDHFKPIFLFIHYKQTLKPNSNCGLFKRSYHLK